jgi:hypothetical protein
MLIDEMNNMLLNNDFSPSRFERMRISYERMSSDEKVDFFHDLQTGIEVGKSEITKMFERALATEHDDMQWNHLISEIRTMLDSPRIKLFRKFINYSDGLKVLLDIRRDILSIQRKTGEDFSLLDWDLTYLLNSWFENGFLVLQEITSDSPYRQINYIKQHDMVHPMSSIEQMGKRLGFDRRCFAFYHFAMPQAPVIFIEIALTRGLARSIDQIIGQQSVARNGAEQLDTAIFYSINNTQEGLAGIGLGKLLIYQVVDFLQRNLPQLQTFATLSPIPGFWEKYLKRILEDSDTSNKMTKDGILEAFSKRSTKILTEEYALRTGSKEKDFSKIILAILTDSNWINNGIYKKHFEKPLVEIADFYIRKEKDRKGRPLNSVANFHISNGATVTKKNINFLGNISERGLTDSCGIMVNYVYSRTWFQRARRSFRVLLKTKNDSERH